MTFSFSRSTIAYSTRNGRPDGFRSGCRRDDSRRVPSGSATAGRLRGAWRRPALAERGQPRHLPPPRIASSRAATGQDVASR